MLFKRGSVVKGSRSNTYLKRNAKIWGTCPGRPAGSDVREARPGCPWGLECRPGRLPRVGHASFFTLWPCKVARLFEGRGQLDSNEIKVAGSRCSREPKGKVHGEGDGGRGLSRALCRPWAPGGFRQRRVQLRPQAGADGGRGSRLPCWTVPDPPPSHGVQGRALRLGVSMTCPVTAVGRLDSFT